MESSRVDELGLGFLEIEAATAKGLAPSTIFHILKEIIGFVLYMHQQIPNVLQHLELEFDTLRKDCKNLESVPTNIELKISSRRKHNGRIREVKQGIRKLEKLMNSISSLLSAIQLTLHEVPDIQRVILILGASVIRPLHVYEIFFSHGRDVFEGENDSTKSKVADSLSRKVIRALVSNGAGGGSYAGPMKLFLLVKAPATSNLAQHFLPKRDLKYSKKIVPFRLHIKCKIHDRYMDESHHTSQASDSTSLLDSSSNEMIWFQSKHTIKGLACKAQFAE
ncbi:non-structural protein [Tasmannia lanceolata]|uniref:non-structural protein n=1 Tax=Tasmannia lanceolata TaxID=3420 RepID=UPI004063A24D